MYKVTIVGHAKEPVTKFMAERPMLDMRIMVDGIYRKVRECVPIAAAEGEPVYHIRVSESYA